MGSTGEHDRKRRRFNSLVSPTAAAKKQPFAPLSEDKKLDTAVLQFQNQKLAQKLEAQKAERVALEHKFSQLREKQLPYDSTLAVVNKFLEGVVADLESRSNRAMLHCGREVKHRLTSGDGNSYAPEDVFLGRILETGATESSSESTPRQMEEDRDLTDQEAHLKDSLYVAAMQAQAEDDSSSQMISGDLEKEIKNRELQSHRDSDAKNKAELKHLRGELDCTLVVEESSSNLATLKVKPDAA